MDRKLKAKWVKALRSGQYRQGDSALCNGQGTRFCCLGVLADIQGHRWTEDAEGFLVPVHKKSGRPALFSSVDILPASLAGGLPKKVQNELANMNDGAGAWCLRGKQSFKAIADYIEANL